MHSDDLPLAPVTDVIKNTLVRKSLVPTGRRRKLSGCRKPQIRVVLVRAPQADWLPVREDNVEIAMRLGPQTARVREEILFEDDCVDDLPVDLFALHVTTLP